MTTTPTPHVSGTIIEDDIQPAALSIAAMIEEWYEGPRKDHLPARLVEKRLRRFLAAIQPDPQPIPDRVPPSLSLSSGDVELTATTDQPGPVCGLEAPAPDPQPVASEPVACSADHLDMATPECPVCGAFQEATPSSAPASVAEAARALLADSDAVLRLARAYDREDSAQRGETDPHGDEFQGEDGFESFQADRIACAQAALRALSEESK